MHEILGRNWRFVRLDADSTLDQARAAQSRPVDMPHDWQIFHADRLYEDGDGWYFYPLRLTEEQTGKRVVLHFDGVYMDATVYLNGEEAFTHRYGYTPFFVPLSGRCRAGENELAVLVRYRAPNSRWYSGAGIFRPVTLYVTEPFALLPDGVSVRERSDGNGRAVLHVRAEACGEADGGSLSCALLSPGGRELFSVRQKAEPVNLMEIPIEDPVRWDLSSPALYTLRLTLNGDTVIKRVGLRETRFDPDEGFFLNGRHVKLHGVCLHHDLGLLGAAFHRDAAERQLRVMMDMGVNAVRTAHNPPAEELLDLCDEMGLMVMDELYDMWELPKTQFDNARFFPDTYPADVASWVRRDRCHPSVILWSIGNEIQDMHVSDRGQYWTRTLMEEVRKHDQSHAPVTFGSNYMPWEGAQKCADIVKLAGYNYAEKLYAGHHRAHPDWIIFGSETASMVQSRGVYHFPMQENILSDEDLQCSELLNSRTSWGTWNVRKMLSADRAVPYSLGQFVWAGIDYIGEPTPYHTRSCYFGQTDTACFPKDGYHLYRAFWTDEPMIWIGAVWDWNPGQLIDVPVMTNAHSCELFLNGVSLGVKKNAPDDAEYDGPVWQVPYEPGTLEAVGYGSDGRALCRDERVSFKDPVRLVLEGENAQAKAGGLFFIRVSALDEKGRPVLNANSRVRVRVSGPGVLLGLDNGDSTDEDGYRTDCRRLFSGKLLIMVGAMDTPGTVRVRAESDGLDFAEWTGEVLPGAGPFSFTGASACLPAPENHFRDIRRITLEAARTPVVLTPDEPTVRVRVRTFPEGAAVQPLSFRVVTAQGVDVPWAKADVSGDTVVLTGQGDGRCFLRASADNGAGHPRILSQLECEIRGFGAVSLDPYRFIAGSLYDVSRGQITPGNEKGIAFAREGWSLAGFSRVDFGTVGSDTVTIPIFALNGEKYSITVWDGLPDEGGQKLCVLSYQKPSIWNVYQEETYRLPRVLRGLHTLCFSMDQKVHMKGFVFARQSRAFRGESALNADQVYGDSFVRTGDAVTRIGNNVTLLFSHMDMEQGGKVTLLLDGLTRHDQDAVTVRVRNGSGEEAVETCLFRKAAARGEQRFSMTVPKGECEAAFVFLPGSDFDFYGFRFVRETAE